MHHFVFYIIADVLVYKKGRTLSIQAIVKSARKQTMAYEHTLINPETDVEARKLECGI